MLFWQYGWLVAYGLKMESKEFYIKYLSNRPVNVETYYVGGDKRQRPLADVCDLIAAYKIYVAPLLDHCSIAEINLHSSVDQIEIPANTPLASIQQPLGSYDFPLIIQSMNGLEGKI